MADVLKGGGPAQAASTEQALTSKASTRRRRVVICGACVSGVAVLLAAAYLVAGYAVYLRLSAVGSRPEDAPNTPASFAVHLPGRDDFDASPYFMPDFEDVRFQSREAGVELAGWYVKSDPGGGAVVLVHGIGDSRRRHSVLLPAGMLARAGFGVLVMDVREHGDSQVIDGRTTLGNEEHLDVLGGWDWLVARGHGEGRVGLFGASLGAATALIAMSEEPRVPAAFADSAFSDVRKIIREELEREGYPTFLASGGTLMARLVSGTDLLARGPSDCIASLGDRALFLAHGLDDARVGAHHGRRLAALAADRGREIKTWFVPGAGHLEAMLASPEEYATRLSGFFRDALGTGERERRR
ncbi:MAG: alpha/beta hydrolase [Planctomycetota bacterium]|jgi:dipeptidyl aminopeptidase/acylaminoacyl peptidase